MLRPPVLDAASPPNVSPARSGLCSVTGMKRSVDVATNRDSWLRSLDEGCGEERVFGQVGAVSSVLGTWDRWKVQALLGRWLWNTEQRQHGVRKRNERFKEEISGHVSTCVGGEGRSQQRGQGQVSAKPTKVPSRVGEGWS